MIKPSLYIHIPFCRSKCPYCDFYSIPYDGNLANHYIDIILKQLRGLGCGFSSIYIGGGTPTVLEKELLDKLLSGLRAYLSKGIEFTIEANPDSLDKEKLGLFLDNGINRLSLGVQSFRDDKLEKLGRVHNAALAIKAVYTAYQTGFRNISIDLIFGLWDEAMDAWQGELEKAAALPITHISCYSLSCEKHTPLFAKLKKGNITGRRDEAAAKMYEWAMRFLPERGFKQYEVSNFSKNGCSCRHNLTYWENGPYVGLGASAVSYFNGTREQNICSVEGYIKSVGEGKTFIIFKEKLEPEGAARETAALKIRTWEGIDYCWFKKKTGLGFLDLERDVLERLVSDGLVAYKQNGGKAAGICLTAKGFLFCDTVSSAFL